MCTEHLLRLHDINSKLGFGTDGASSEMARDSLEHNKTMAIEDIAILKSQKHLPSDIFDRVLKVNRFNRLGYTEFLKGQKAARKAGFSSMETLLPFDKKFEPEEGWKKYMEEFEGNVDFI